MNIRMFDFLKRIWSDQTMEVPRVDYEPLNGRLITNLIIPDDIIMKIFEYLKGGDILMCRLVCKNWDSLTVETIHHLYCKRFQKSPEKLPLRYLFIRLYRGVFGTNLLRNTNGEQGFKHWEIVRNGGDRFKVEDIPQGAPLLPENVSEFNGRMCCFATSFRTCEKVQTIVIRKNTDIDYLLKHKVKVYVSEWVCARFDCGATYQMKVVLKGKNGNTTEATAEHTEEQWMYAPWRKIEMEIDSYPENVERIEFRHFGRDTQFWAGHYGMKMAGSVLKLLPID